MSFIQPPLLSRLGAVLLVALLCCSYALLNPGAELRTAKIARIPVLILTGDGSTDWRWTSTHLRGLLEDSGKFDVEISVVPEGTLADPWYLQRFELLLVDYAGLRWGEPAETNFLNAVKAGTGVVALGDAVAAFRDWKEYEQLVGFHCKDEVYRENFQPQRLQDRHPEATTHYRVVQRHLETWLAQARTQERIVPAFVERELRAFAGVGQDIPAFGAGPQPTSIWLFAWDRFYCTLVVFHLGTRGSSQEIRWGEA